MYQTKKSFRVRLVFKKDFNTGRFFAEMFVGTKRLFTSKSYNKKEHLKDICERLIYDLYVNGLETYDVTKSTRGPNPRHTENVQEDKYKQFKKENGLE